MRREVREKKKRRRRKKEEKRREKESHLVLRVILGFLLSFSILLRFFFREQ
jgi:hypothetical protein